MSFSLNPGGPGRSKKEQNSDPLRSSSSLRQEQEESASENSGSSAGTLISSSICTSDFDGTTSSEKSSSSPLDIQHSATVKKVLINTSTLSESSPKSILRRKGPSDGLRKKKKITFSDSIVVKERSYSDSDEEESSNDDDPSFQHFYSSNPSSTTSVFPSPLPLSPRVLGSSSALSNSNPNEDGTDTDEPSLHYLRDTTHESSTGATSTNRRDSTGSQELEAREKREVVEKEREELQDSFSDPGDYVKLDSTLKPHEDFMSPEDYSELDIKIDKNTTSFNSIGVIQGAKISATVSTRSSTPTVPTTMAAMNTTTASSTATNVPSSVSNSFFSTPRAVTQVTTNTFLPSVISNTIPPASRLSFSGSDLFSQDSSTLLITDYLSRKEPSRADISTASSVLDRAQDPLSRSDTTLSHHTALTKKEEVENIEKKEESSFHCPDSSGPTDNSSNNASPSDDSSQPSPPLDVPSLCMVHAPSFPGEEHHLVLMGGDPPLSQEEIFQRQDPYVDVSSRKHNEEGKISSVASCTSPSAVRPSSASSPSLSRSIDRQGSRTALQNTMLGSSSAALPTEKGITERKGEGVDLNPVVTPLKSPPKGLIQHSIENSPPIDVWMGRYRSATAPCFGNSGGSPHINPNYSFLPKSVPLRMYCDEEWPAEQDIVAHDYLSTHGGTSFEALERMAHAAANMHCVQAASASPQSFSFSPKRIQGNAHGSDSLRAMELTKKKGLNVIPDLLASSQAEMRVIQKDAKLDKHHRADPMDTLPQDHKKRGKTIGEVEDGMLFSTRRSLAISTIDNKKINATNDRTSTKKKKKLIRLILTKRKRVGDPKSSTDPVVQVAVVPTSLRDRVLAFSSAAASGMGTKAHVLHPRHVPSADYSQNPKDTHSQQPPMSSSPPPNIDYAVTSPEESNYHCPPTSLNAFITPKLVGITPVEIPYGLVPSSSNFPSALPPPDVFPGRTYKVEMEEHAHTLSTAALDDLYRISPFKSPYCSWEGGGGKVQEGPLSTMLSRPSLVGHPTFADGTCIPGLPCRGVSSQRRFPLEGRSSTEELTDLWLLNHKSILSSTPLPLAGSINENIEHGGNPSAMNGTMGASLPSKMSVVPPSTGVHRKENPEKEQVLKDEILDTEEFVIQNAYRIRQQIDHITASLRHPSPNPKNPSPPSSASPLPLGLPPPLSRMTTATEMAGEKKWTFGGKEKKKRQDPSHRKKREKKKSGSKSHRKGKDRKTEDKANEEKRKKKRNKKGIEKKQSSPTSSNLHHHFYEHKKSRGHAHSHHSSSSKSRKSGHRTKKGSSKREDTPNNRALRVEDAKPVAEMGILAPLYDSTSAVIPPVVTPAQVVRDDTFPSPTRDSTALSNPIPPTLGQNGEKGEVKVRNKWHSSSTQTHIPPMNSTSNRPLYPPSSCSISPSPPRAEDTSPSREQRQALVRQAVAEIRVKRYSTFFSNQSSIRFFPSTFTPPSTGYHTLTYHDEAKAKGTEAANARHSYSPPLYSRLSLIEFQTNREEKEKDPHEDALNKFCAITPEGRKSRYMFSDAEFIMDKKGKRWRDRKSYPSFVHSPSTDILASPMCVGPFFDSLPQTKQEGNQKSDPNSNPSSKPMREPIFSSFPLSPPSPFVPSPVEESPTAAGITKIIRESSLPPSLTREGEEPALAQSESTVSKKIPFFGNPFSSVEKNLSNRNRSVSPSCSDGSIVKVESEINRNPVEIMETEAGASMQPLPQSLPLHPSLEPQSIPEPSLTPSHSLVEEKVPHGTGDIQRAGSVNSKPLPEGRHVKEAEENNNVAWSSSPVSSESILPNPEKKDELRCYAVESNHSPPVDSFLFSESSPTAKIKVQGEEHHLKVDLSYLKVENRTISTSTHSSNGFEPVFQGKTESGEMEDEKNIDGWVDRLWGCNDLYMITDMNKARQFSENIALILQNLSSL